MSFVYFIRDAASGLIKIGTTANVRKRFATLRTGSSSDLELVGVSAKLDEKRLHAMFAADRKRGEWFQSSTEMEAIIASCEIDLLPLKSRKTKHGDHPIHRLRGRRTLVQLAKDADFSYEYLRLIAGGFRRPSFFAAERIAAVLVSDEQERLNLTVEMMRYPCNRHYATAPCSESSDSRASSETSAPTLTASTKD